ncbi:MAG: hypothetical protein R2941_04770 [Desulfobacterales bacterium]
MGIKGILLDTNAYAAFKQNNPDAVEIIKCMPLIGISTIVLGELLAGFAVGRREKDNRQELSSFLKSERAKLFSVNQNTAECLQRFIKISGKKEDPYRQMICGLPQWHFNTDCRYSPMIRTSGMWKKLFQAVVFQIF